MNGKEIAILSRRFVLTALVIGFMVSPVVAQTVSPRAEAPASRFLVPFFEVDYNDGQGVSTLFAIRNESTQTVSVTIDYFEVDRPASQVPQRSDEVVLGPKQTTTVNVRFVEDLLRDPDNFARGYIVFTSMSSALQGDYFQIDRAGNFAFGERLINIDSQSFHNELCQSLSARFFNGGGFDAGTELTFWLDTEQPPSLGEAVAFYKIYNEAGDEIFSSQIFSEDVAFTLQVADLALPPPAPALPSFGTVEIQFAATIGTSTAPVSGHVTVGLSASNRYSVGFEAVCLDAGMF
ncbi:MAG: hypothetical protein AAGD38_18685 [Acidobacteriota bacterium]